MATTTKISSNEIETLRRENDELRAAITKLQAAPLTLAYKPHPESHVERVLVVNRIHVTIAAAEARKITALLRGLIEARAVLASGMPVHLPQHAVQWMLEQLKLVG